MAGLTPKPKSFFKFMAPGFQKTLSIPPSFYGSLNEKNLDQGRIKSCLGSWNVKVVRRSDGVLYFGDGWIQFVKHHRLKVGDFIVFQLKGNLVFHAVVYESLGNQKEFPPAASRVTTAVRASTPTNPPSFRKLITKTHGNPAKAYFTIPAVFVRSHGLAGISTLTLRDPVGRKWPVKIGTWQGGARDYPVCLRTAIRTKEWYAFYTANKLKEGDVCTFDLHWRPKSRSHPVIFNVQIFRQ